MQNVEFITILSGNEDTIVLLIAKDGNFDESLIDLKLKEIVTKALEDKSVFTGKFGQAKNLTIYHIDKMLNLVLLGMGDESKLKSSSFEKLGGKVAQCATVLRTKTLNVCIPATIGDFNSSSISAYMASGLVLRSYKFDKYFTKQKEEEKYILSQANFLSDDLEKSKQLFAKLKAIAEGVYLARNCISEPPNVLFPESYANIVLDELEQLGIKIDVLGEREMRNLGMGALLGVGQGSANESKLVVMKYENGAKNKAPIAFVGKGVTFDTGGISIKPSNGMADMKYDMAGSAAVVGLMKALVLRKAAVNVVGIIGLVENMPGGSAQRPGDVVKTMSGQTAEVLDTDAEGRLVLADALWYAQDKFSPEVVIDLATLTGAIVVALGSTYGGMFTNDDKLSSQLVAAGEKVDEKLWRMPLHPDFDDMIKSEIADVANLGSVRGAAGSSTAAHFLARFIKEGVAWAHLDIAGMAWEKKGSSICPKGAVGYGVRLLDKFIEDNYESTS